MGSYRSLYYAARVSGPSPGFFAPGWHSGVIPTGTTDNPPPLDEVPLLTMARAAIKSYQLSADYFTSLRTNGLRGHHLGAVVLEVEARLV